MIQRILIAAAVLCSCLAFSDLPYPPLRAQEVGAEQTGVEIPPWPENRLHSYYANRARAWLKQQKPLPDLLPPYPGLDGGTFGHWGQYPAQRSLDASMSEVEFGGLMSTVTGHFRKITTKALIVQPGDRGEMTALFDPSQLSFVDVWEGPLATFSPAMLGLITPATPRGDQLINLQASKWNVPEETYRQYVGLYRHGRNVVFRYRIGDADILDRSWKIDEHFARSLQVDGALPSDCSLTLLDSGSGETKTLASGLQTHTIGSGNDMLTIALRGDGAQLEAINGKVQLNFSVSEGNELVHIAFIRGDAKTTTEAFAAANIPRPDSLTRGGTSQWGDRTVTTQGELGTGDGAFVIDTLTIPAAERNGFNVPFRVSGFTFLPDNRCVVATLYGDIWIVDGIDDDLNELTWKRVASGLHQPLGVLYQNEKLLVTGRDQITHLQDLNGDGEFDFYECLTNGYSTAPGHEVVTNLRADEEQNLYFSNAVDGIMKYDYREKSLEVIGSGIRYCNGVEVSPDGQVVLATAQEGPWTPATAIFDVGGKSYHGLRGPKKNVGKYGYDLPMCYIPRGVDPSAGQLSLMPKDVRIGPLAGHYVGVSSSNCTHYLVLREENGGAVQGGVVPLPGDFLSGAHRIKFNANDGHIYVAGTQSWQSYAREQGSLQRLRFTEKPLDVPTAVETHDNGMTLHFNCQIDPESVKLANVFCEQWNYLYSPAYGSEEYSVRESGRPGHDPVDVKSVHLRSDGRSVFVEIPQLHPVMQLHLFLQLQSIDDGSKQSRTFEPDLYYTVHSMKESYSDFPGYTKIAKDPFPDLPVIKEYPRDPRLVAQDDLSRSFEFATGLESRRITAVPGLRFEPNQIHVPPRGRVALTFKNGDITMRHNLAVVEKDRLTTIGEASMIMAADPAAIAKHYVPDDPGVIALSPVLNPDDQYTVYFRAPAKSGLYRIVCTFPGHWTVMRGWLVVAAKGEQIQIPKEEPQRDFVKMWMTKDLAGDAENLHNRSVAKGRVAFEAAGCFKCHVVGGKGEKLGPELTDISKRFTGAKLLNQILDPNAEINKEFQTHVFLTDDGKTIAGLIVSEDDNAIHVLPNPLKPEEITVVQKSTLEDRRMSKLSTMPKGLLMTFTKDEILDLVAFLQSAGGNAADQ